VVVFTAVSDPFGPGFVTNLARPGANVTGFMNLEASIGGKWLELMKEVAPRAARVTVLYSSTTAAAQAAYYHDPIEAAASSFGVATQWAPWAEPGQIEDAIASSARRPDAGLIIIPAPHTPSQRALIISRANQYRLPAVYLFRFWVHDGGLVCYGIDLADLHRRAAGYIDRIPHGYDIPNARAIAYDVVSNRPEVAASRAGQAHQCSHTSWMAS
jgi:putative ABC transport system substrate-binding protein